VNGLVNGAGLHMVVDADTIVAVETAAFMDTHVNVGMVGAIENIGRTKRLPLGTALRMTLQGRAYRLSARRAHELGLVYELVAPEELMATAEAIAADAQKKSPHATQLSKQALSTRRGQAPAVDVHGLPLAVRVLLGPRNQFGQPQRQVLAPQLLRLQEVRIP
jgi:enoyl-CoA hydratase/carnithine racemase